MTFDFKTERRIFLTKLKISFFFPVFHCCFGAFVVSAGAAFGLAGGGDFGNHIIEVGGVGFDGSGAGGITDGAETHDAFFDGFVILRLEEIGDGEERAIALENFAFMREVDRGQRNFLALDIHPNVHLGEIREREYAEVFAGILATIEKIPQLRALIFWVPLTEVIAVGEEALLGAGFFFITATTSEAAIVLMLFDGIEQGHGLQFVA